MRSAQRIPPLRSLAVACALSGSALLLTACANTETASSNAAAAAPTSPAPASPPAESPTPSLSKDQTERKDLVSKAKVTWNKAADTAVKEIPDSKLVDLELKGTPRHMTASPGTAGTGTPAPAPSPGAPEWEAKVAAADGTVHQVDIDAVSGKVFRSQVEADQDADDKRKVADRLSKARQTPEQAVKAATDRAKGTVTGLELDENDNQQLVWSIDVVNTDNWHKTTVDVDAANGKVVREHTDRD
jgi:uncharacterized membrane protein YkoI